MSSYNKELNRGELRKNRARDVGTFSRLYLD